VRRDGTPSGLKTLLSGTRVKAFNLLYTRKTGNYLLAYQTGGMLRVQILSRNLSRLGPSILIQRGVKQARPEFIADRGSNRIFLLWLGGDSKTIRIQEIGANGHPIGTSIALVKAGTATSFRSFNAAANPKGRHLIVSNEAIGTSTRIAGYLFDSNSKLVRPSAIVFHQIPATSAGEPVSVFSVESANGVAAWSAGNQIRYRFLNPQGTFAGRAQTIQNAADASSERIAAYHDLKKEEFVAVWAKGKELLASIIKPVRSTNIEKPSKIANGEGVAINPSVAYDAAAARALIVWEERASNSLRIRSAVVLVRAEEFAVQGRVVLRKDYDPPFIVNEYKYLAKLHVRSNGKLYRAYVTPETEVVGTLPREGDTIRMIYEPFRSKYRGYVEEIRILNTEVGARSSKP
jgi:hypothetical protein